MQFQIVCDSSCDMPMEKITEWGIGLVSYYVSFDQEKYYREGREITPEDFYQMMVDRPGSFPVTSMPTVYDYGSAIYPFLKAGMPVLCICLNSKFSGSYQSAVNAARMLKEEYPKAEIYVMDSQLATVLEGLLVRAVERLEAIRSTGRIFFTTNDLKYLAHGGRIGKAAAATGTILQMKPMIEYYDAQLNSAGVVRGRKASLRRCLELFRTYVEKEGLDLSQYHIATGYGYDQAEYDGLNGQVDQLLREMGHPWEKLGDFHIGVTIGVHTGPYPIGMGILRKA